MLGAYLPSNLLSFLRQSISGAAGSRLLVVHMFAADFAYSAKKVSIFRRFLVENMDEVLR